MRRDLGEKEGSRVPGGYLCSSTLFKSRARCVLLVFSALAPGPSGQRLAGAKLLLQGISPPSRTAFEVILGREDPCLRRTTCDRRRNKILSLSQAGRKIKLPLDVSDATALPEGGCRGCRV